MSTVFVLVDLGYGDQGKGTTAHWLSSVMDAHTVVRTGGGQGFHSVVTKEGVEMIHSHFGAGTLAGSKTHISDKMIIEPYCILNEGRYLIKIGINNAFDRLTIDENALMVTPFHSMASRIRELARGDQRHSSVGRGIGETALDFQLYEETAVQAKDIGKPWLWEKLAAIRKRKLEELVELIDRVEMTSEAGKENISMLKDERLINEAVAEFNLLGKTVDIVDSGYLGQILNQPGTVIFEPSQGVLLDQWAGFHPYTTMADPTFDSPLTLLKCHNFQGQVVKLGILRGSHSTRHGNGPFVTESDELTSLLPDPRNPFNQWQGNFRVGHFDTVAARYAIEVCGGCRNFDGLVLTCLDQLAGLPKQSICNAYSFQGGQFDAERFVFQDDKIVDIKVRLNSRDHAQLEYQQQLGELLNKCRPVLTNLETADVNGYIQAIENQLDLPVLVGSFGPTENDKQVLRTF